MTTKPLFMARDLSNGLIRFSSVDNSFWFTYTTC